MKKKEKRGKDETKEAVRKTFRAFDVILTVGLLLFAAVFVAVLTFVGVRFWNALATLLPGLK